MLRKTTCSRRVRPSCDFAYVTHCQVQIIIQRQSQYRYHITQIQTTFRCGEWTQIIFTTSKWNKKIRNETHIQVCHL